MKILIFIPTYSHEPIGKYARMNDLLFALSKTKKSPFIPIIITFKHIGNYSPWKVYELKGPKIIRYINLLKIVRSLSKEVDIIHFVSLPSFFSFIIYLIKNKTTPLVGGPNIAPMVWNNFNSVQKKFFKKEHIFFHLKCRFHNNLFEKIKLSERFSFINPSFFFCFSQEHKKNMTHYYNTKPEKVVVLPHGVRKDCFSIRNNTSNKNNIFTLLYVGPFNYHKGYTVFLKSLNLLQSKINNFKVVIVGEGNKQEKIINSEVRSKVEFKNPLPRKELKKFYHQADVYIQPSLSEASSTTMIESLACGTPVVASDGKSFREIGKGENTAYFPYGNHQELYKKILYMYNNYSSYKEFTMKNASFYNIKRALPLVKEVYKKVLKN